jgi:PPE family protein
MGIGEYNWDAWSHEDLHAMINGRGGGLVGILEGTTGRGAAGGSEAAEAWGRFTTLMDDLQRRTADALVRAGVSWEGRASESARAGITPLGQWAGDAGTAGAATRGGTDSLVGFYSSARNAMPEPVAASSTANSDFLGIPAGFTHLLGGQTDQDQQERAAQEAKLEAVRVLDSYREHSAASVADLGRFIPPPTVVTEIGVVAPEVAPVGETPSGITTTLPAGVTVENGTPQATPPPVVLPESRPPVVDEAPTTVVSGRPAPDAVPPTTGVRDTTTSGSVPNRGEAPVESAVRTGAGRTAETGDGPAAGVRNGMGGRSGTGTRSGPGTRSGTGVRNTTGTRSGPGIGGGVPARSAPPGGQPGPVVRGGGGAGVLGEQAAVRQQNPATAKALPGGAVAPASRPPDEEDLERFTPDYLNGSHDEFWGAEPSDRVAPPVIGG